MRGNNRTLWSINILLFLVSLSLIAGCSKETNVKNTVLKNGLIYEKGNGKLFSGYVVGKGRDDYRRERMIYKKQYKNGRLNGTLKYWYRNGQVESVEPYSNGKINGVITRYYENGQVKARIHLVDGQRGGYKGEMFWNENGQRI